MMSDSGSILEKGQLSAHHPTLWVNGLFLKRQHRAAADPQHGSEQNHPNQLIAQTSNQDFFWPRANLLQYKNPGDRAGTTTAKFLYYL